MWIPSPDQMLFILILLFGFYLGRKMPTNRMKARAWLFNRRGTPYFVCYILDAGKIINMEIIKQIENSYLFKEKIYLLTAGTEGKTYTPSIILNGQLLVFHTLDNVNPLEFKKGAIEHLYNDASIVGSMVANKDIGSAIKTDQSEEYSALRRYILIMDIILLLGAFAMMWFLTGQGA
jgi:hypothetical protein